ncbi:MAG: single-stranded-DNA-specific exonuclease RecJ [Patescibacteria group bacterium]
MIKTWRVRPTTSETEFNYPSALLRQLLVGRGLASHDEAEKFLNPDYERDLHDPFLMTDMDRAVERIMKAIKKNEKIAIYADYDADGVPGAAIVSSFFNQIGFENFLVYIPDRHMEAYGLNDLALGALAQKGVKLVVTVDCGVTDVGPVAEANRLGLEVIITDHHLVPETLPAAYAIVNPKRSGDEYPYKMLAGAGVAFKLVQALSRWDNFRVFTRQAGSDADENSPSAPAKNFSPASAQAFEKWLLDLVAIATVSDMVPLTGENRALVHFGLKVLRRTRRPGLRALAQVLKLNLPFIAEDDIGFMIGPRLNSASRMSHGDEAYALLMATDEVEAERLAYHLEGKNKERRASVTQILEAAGEGGAGGVLLLGDPSWSLGVLGLAASRLVEERRQPVFLWGKNGNGTLKGSCRSDGTVNIVELMKLADELAPPKAGLGGKLFTNYGGHAQAGGFSIEPKNLSKLEPSLNAAYAALEKLPTDGGDIYYDLELPFDIISHDTHRILDQLAPFGVENHKPVFYFPKLPLASKKFFGNGTKHLELTFPHPDLGTVKAIKFFVPDGLPQGKEIDLLATLEKSYFRNRPELRLRIIDWREVI